jgi:hypothetical protein
VRELFRRYETAFTIENQDDFVTGDTAFGVPHEPLLLVAFDPSSEPIRITHVFGLNRQQLRKLENQGVPFLTGNAMELVRPALMRFFAAQCQSVFQRLEDIGKGGQTTQARDHLRKFKTDKIQ